MQAAHHWNVLANDVASRINSELIRQNYIDTAVYVRHSCSAPDACGPGDTFPFDEGFNDLLTTQLVNFGVKTLVREDDGLIVDYKVQLIQHRANRRQWPQPGVLTALTAGILVFRDAPWEISTLAAAATVDALNAVSVTHGHFEIVITTSIVDGNRYVMRTSDLYYINDVDFWQYQQPKPATEVGLVSRSVHSPAFEDIEEAP
ncbi:hypothetical protein [Desulfobulbus alkaliphilus]|uniref:hypothetical protein n=1 Tax=Desulfobulbus alkaliphilus TaxID=869814 RepID=UPI001965A228|nr:hypothetical protein [Desulfobulbus alkaliphilus]MBM9535846.1 hypothetical protein [Desulfobulbus alkaliphilus]